MITRKPVSKMTGEERAQQAEISLQIQRIMEKRDFTIGDLAEKLGVNYADAKRIVEKPMGYSMAIIGELCKVLNIEITGTKIKDLEE